jgi:hypothetical protein
MFCARDDELALIESSAPEPAEPAVALAVVKPEDKPDVALQAELGTGENRCCLMCGYVWLINYIVSTCKYKIYKLLRPSKCPQK